MIEFESASNEIGKCLATMRKVEKRDELQVGEEGISAFDRLYLQCALYMREYNRIAERLEDENVRYAFDEKRGALFFE